MMTNEVRGAKTDEEAERRKAVDEKIAKDPYGDTFEHFARLCRSYTGSNFLDSGSAYGYTYQKPMRDKGAPAIRFERESYQCKTHEEWFEKMRDLAGLEPHEPVRLSDLSDRSPGEVMVWISLEHWMAHNLQATSETRWLNKLYAWWENAINDSARSFDTDEFIAWAHEVALSSMAQLEDRAVANELSAEVRGRRAKLLLSVSSREHRRDLLALLKEEDERGFFDVLLDDDDEIARVSGGNTYNEDNDLSQDLQWHAYGVERRDLYGVKLLAVQPHCGCDARGGYPQPVWYSVEDSEAGWVDWRVQFWLGDGNDIESKHLRFVPLDWWREQRPDLDTLTLPGVADVLDPDDWDEGNATVVDDPDNGEKWILVYAGGERWAKAPVGCCNVRYHCGEIF